MSLAAATLLSRAPRHSAQRRRIADVLARAVEEGGDIAAVSAVDNARPGYLRYAIIDAGRRSPRPDLGILRGYPKSLADLEELRPALVGGDAPTPGVDRLCASLFTLPTHDLVRSRDLEQIIEWLRIPARLIVSPSARSRSLDVAEK
jgi:hypothetical protein